jgi:anti-sigma regulatory factor (Ser/Thr protein kinase)
MMAHPCNGPDERESTLTTIFELALVRNLHAPSVARAAVIEHRDDFELTPSLCHTLVLLVSELVSNAVVHSRGPVDSPILLTADIAQDVVRVAVSDSGKGFTPRPRRPEMANGGYGLYIVEKATRSWGVDCTASETTVWFELERADPGN